MWIAYGLLLVAVGMDLKTMKISNRLIFFGILVSLIRRFFLEGLVGLFTGIVLISIPIIFLYLLFLAGALGAGDIKLFSLIGGFVHLKELMYCMLFAFLFAGVFSLFKIIFHGTFLLSMKSAGRYAYHLLQGRWERYQPVGIKENKMHFSVAILFGFTAMKLFILL